MFNSNQPKDEELPSTEALVRSTALAIIVAIVLMFTVVMPAEYGRDPTGVGRLLGLTTMGEIKQSLEEEVKQQEQIAHAQNMVAEANEVVEGANPTSTTTEAKVATQLEPQVTEQPAAAIPTPLRSDEMTVTLVPNQGTEIKLTMKKGQKVSYSWTLSKGRANYDIHGDSETLKIDYHGYGKGSKEADQGTLEAAFDGSHGWFWRNRTNETIKITLKTEGDYSNIKHVK